MNCAFAPRAKETKKNVKAQVEIAALNPRLSFCLHPPPASIHPTVWMANFGTIPWKVELCSFWNFARVLFDKKLTVGDFVTARAPGFNKFQSVSTSRPQRIQQELFTDFQAVRMLPICHFGNVTEMLNSMNIRIIRTSFRRPWYTGLQNAGGKLWQISASGFSFSPVRANTGFHSDAQSCDNNTTQYPPNAWLGCREYDSLLLDSSLADNHQASWCYSGASS